ncbi:PREDICTED: protein TWIN LOV 1-like isoform X2 [Camelina sativa]|uniref:Protein TWIN LOV 1-like isoform X2 n=1 Tax=Camelina sativa TaxID=90675 RepID=A0ABM0ZD15_CAMSA|nr:PREDICTED: protein TWIN LOV 1-like isoform X2 [Camelina sativa]
MSLAEESSVVSVFTEEEEESLNRRYTLWIKEALDELPHNFTITDPFLSGHPIVFASLGFLKMTGYSRAEVIGRNGKFFQGPKTNRRSIMEIREAIREERSVQVSLLNYRKSGSPFWMLFHMIPVFGRDDGKVINFVAVQVPISGRDHHRKLTSVGDDVSSLDHSEFVFGSCRREVCFGNFVQHRALPVECDDDEQGLEDWEYCEASESEKLRAVEAINNVLSVLTRYSELSGRLVCGKRYCLRGVDCLSSSLVISLGRIKQSFVLTNPCIPDMPIIYASDAFLTLTGYKRHEVLGQNCRFLSGVDTDSSVLYEMKECILKGQSCTVQILNYRKDKSTFWNLLHISPVRNASGKTAYFVGVQVEASCRNTESKELRPETKQLSVVGAVRVAVRSSFMVTC